VFTASAVIGAATSAPSAIPDFKPSLGCATGAASDRAVRRAMIENCMMLFRESEIASFYTQNAFKHVRGWNCFEQRCNELRSFETKAIVSGNTLSPG
jgi:hypothetical protein